MPHRLLLVPLFACCMCLAATGQTSEDVRTELLARWAKLGDEQPAGSATWTEKEKLRYVLYRDLFNHFDGDLAPRIEQVVPSSDLKLMASWPAVDQRRYAQYVLHRDGKRQNDKGKLRLTPHERRIAEKRLNEGRSAADRFVFELFLPGDKERMIRSHARRRRIELMGDVDTPVPHPLPPRPEAKADVEQEPAPLSDRPGARQAEGDDLLRRAMEAYRDGDEPRDTAVTLFTQYLDRFPKTPFAAEIQVKLGNLYCTHRRKNEKHLKDRAREHYVTAHKLYDGKYTAEHATIWQTLVNWNETDFTSAYGDYLEWMYGLQDKGTYEDVWPIRSITMHLKGHPNRLSRKERRKVISWARHEIIPGLLWSGHENVLSSISRDKEALSEVAARFGNQEVGRRAREVLEDRFGVVPEPVEHKKPIQHDSSRAVRPEELAPDDATSLKQSANDERAASLRQSANEDIAYIVAAVTAVFAAGVIGLLVLRHVRSRP